MGSLVLVLLCALVVLAAAARRAALAPEPASAAASVAPASESSAEAPAASASAPRWPSVDGGAEEEASCSIPDRGLGAYGPWQTLPVGRMSAPRSVADSYDLVLHLHGGEAARRIVAPEDLAVVLVTVDAGVGSQVYSETMYGPEPLEDILGAVDSLLAPARLRHLILSSWSAGYGGIREILSQHPTAADAVVLLDSLHASYTPDGETLVETGLGVFVSAAQRAVQGEEVMVFTHSDIRPPSYASTTELGSYLLSQLGGRRAYGGLLDSHGVQLKTRFDSGRFHLRGYTGTGKEAHCAQLRLLGDILRDDVLPALAEMDRSDR